MAKYRFEKPKKAEYCVVAEAYRDNCYLGKVYVEGYLMHIWVRDEGIPVKCETDYPNYLDLAVQLESFMTGKSIEEMGAPEVVTV